MLKKKIKKEIKIEKIEPMNPESMTKTKYAVKMWNGHKITGTSGSLTGAKVEVVLDNGSTTMVPREILE